MYCIFFVLYSQEVANGLKDLLEYDGDVEEDLCQTFMVNNKYST